MDWIEFCERYLTNHEEFRFKYKKYYIDLLYSSNGEKFAYYISEYSEEQNIFNIIKNRNKFIKCEEFNTPQELIDGFIFDDKNFKEIWNEFEWY